MKRTIVINFAVMSLAIGGPLGHAVQAAGSDPQVLIDSHAEQEARLDTSPPAVQVKMDAARQLDAQGRSEQAAAAYLQVAAIYQQAAVADANLPDSPQKQWAQIQAGICYGRIGQTDKAINAFDAAVSKTAASWWAEEALYRKAMLCMNSGRPQDARRAAEFLRIGFPHTTLMDQALQIKGQVDGTSPGQLELQKAKEHQASEVLRLLEAKLKVPKTDKDAYAMALQIEQNYPGTSAAVSALALKGKVLINLHRYDEAHEAYTQLLARASLDAPGSVLIRQANSGCSYAILKRGQDLLDRMRNTKAMTTETYEKIRADMSRVVQLGVGQAYVARAKLMLGELEVCSGKSREGLLLVERYLAEYYATPGTIAQIPLQIMQMHVLVAQAARDVGDYAKVLQAYDRVKAIYGQLANHAQLPRHQKDNYNFTQAMVAACFERFMTLIQTRADSSQINAAGQEVLTLLPTSQHARIVRLYLRPTASLPSP